MSPDRKIGVLGGTFDPIHLGHLTLAREAMRGAGLERVLLVPSGEPPHRAGALAPACDRLAMVGIAVATQPGLSVWSGEVHRQGPSRTFDTLAQLHQIFDPVGLCFILGSDAARELPSWHRYPDILELATFLVMDRPGERSITDLELGSLGLASFNRGAGDDSQLIQVAATDIRARLAARQQLDDLVPPAVADYIRINGLYDFPPP